MIGKSGTVLLFASLLGSTLCVIPEGEIQIGPIFGQGRLFVIDLKMPFKNENWFVVLKMEAITF